jgi:anti-sigma factor RsiW
MASDTWQAEIDRYVDAELSAEQARAMAAHLRQCPSCAAQVLERMQLKRVTKLAGRRYVPSAEFRRLVERRVGARTRLASRWIWVPALALAMVLLLIAGLSLNRWSERLRSQQLLGELADLHVTDLASSTPVEVVSSDRHTVKPWFQGKLPFTFDLPEVQGSQFTLVGGRVVYFQHEPGAHLIYAVRSHRISVFIFRERPELDRTFSAHNYAVDVLAFHAQSWPAGGLRYFVFGDPGSEYIRQLSEMFRKAGQS